MGKLPVVMVLATSVAVKLLSLRLFIPLLHTLSQDLLVMALDTAALLSLRLFVPLLHTLLQDLLVTVLGTVALLSLKLFLLLLSIFITNLDVLDILIWSQLYDY